MERFEQTPGSSFEAESEDRLERANEILGQADTDLESAVSDRGAVERLKSRMNRVGALGLVVMSSLVAVGCGSDRATTESSDGIRVEQLEDDGSLSREQQGIRYVGEDLKTLQDQIESGQLDFEKLETLQIYKAYMYGDGGGRVPSLQADRGGRFAFDSGLQLRALELALATGGIAVDDLTQAIVDGTLEIDYRVKGFIPVEVVLFGQTIKIDPGHYSQAERQRLQGLGALPSETIHQNIVRQGPDFPLN